MTHSHVLLRLAVSTSLIVASFPTALHAQTGPDVTFELRPHCEEQGHAAAGEFGGEVPAIDGTMTLTQDSQAACPEYGVRDPLSRQTEVLKEGDVLDMDLIMHNPSARPIKRFRLWIGYDSNVLEGTELELSDAFPVATPGEADFSIADNYVKLSGTSEQAVTGTKVVLARITMTVKTAPAFGTVLSFYDPSGKEDAHTGAFIREGETDENVASTVQGTLAVRFETSAASAASSVAPVAPVSSAPAAISSVPPLPDPTSTSSEAPVAQSSVPAVVSSSPSSAPLLTGMFSKLQVQSLRVTTEGSSVFLAWNPLPSAELAGYNLYYGTISGRYLQRRSVDTAGQTLTVRALPVGQTYYFAVRAVSTTGEESDFSQEVAVTVGNPATSTSPLSGALIEGGPQGNAPGTGGEIAGDSGPATWLMLFAAASAVMGTLLAFRRQWTASSAIPR